MTLPPKMSAAMRAYRMGLADGQKMPKPRTGLPRAPHAQADNMSSLTPERVERDLYGFALGYFGGTDEARVFVREFMGLVDWRNR